MCDNENQGIVPVPGKLGNGKDPHNNLYRGAAFGVKSFFKNNSSEWSLLNNPKSENRMILDRSMFKHKSNNVYLLAEAYDGNQIKNCIQNFLYAANGNFVNKVTYRSAEYEFGGQSDLIVYVGHDGLMDFEVDINYKDVEKRRDVIILACHSKQYFLKEIKDAKANPILWTTHLMAPEAYTLRVAIGEWILGKNEQIIEEKAAQIYHKYQKCGIKGARNLFTTGF